MQETYTLSTKRRVNPYLIFFIICIVVYLPSCFLRAPFYPDEVRNLYITQNITEAKDYLIPYYLDDNYHEKPPLYFWILKILSKAKTGSTLFLPILFNALIIWALLSLNYKFLKNEGYPDMGFISSLLLSTIGIFYGMGVLARMDILFLFFIFLSVYFLWIAINKNKFTPLILSAIFSFFAVFTKGAFGIIFPLFIGVGMSIFAKRKGAFTKVLFANFITLIFIALWIFSFTKVESIYFEKMILNQTIGRAVNPMIHDESPFYYLPFIFLVLLPWSFIGAGYFFSLKKNKLDNWQKVSLLWFIGGFILLSAIRSKVPMYLLLLTIPFCGLAAKFLIEGKEKIKRIMLYSTIGFFLFMWLGGFIYCKVTGEFLPNAAYLVLGVFLITAFFMVKQSAQKQFKALFIGWVVLIQLLNFIFLPLASGHADINKIAQFLATTDLQFDKVYVDDLDLLQLKIFPQAKEVIYIKDKSTLCRQEKILFISQSEKQNCPLGKIADIEEYKVFIK